jgi:maleamate amidohydrolase
MEATGTNTSYPTCSMPTTKEILSGSNAQGVQPRDDEIVVIKQYSSSFFGTSLPSILTSLECNTLICCGYSTSGCVRASTLDAMQYGFNPYVVRDACGDRHAGVHDSNLFDMDQKFAEVVTESQIFALLEAERRTT